jgi:hypothetical protein
MESRMCEMRSIRRKLLKIGDSSYECGLLKLRGRFLVNTVKSLVLISIKGFPPIIKDVSFCVMLIF